MRTKDRPLLLRRALDSVTSQTYDDWVLVIVNDGGDPPPVEQLVKEYGSRLSSRCLVVHSGKSVGMEAAANIGIRAVGSEYIAIHDDDDSWHPDFLTRTVSFMEAEELPPTTGGVVTHVIRVSERIEGDRVLEESRGICNTQRGITLFGICSRNTIQPIGFVYRRAAFEQVGPYREDLPVLGDWEFNVRFLQLYDVAVIPEPLAHYHQRVHDRNEGSIYANTVVAQADRHLRWEGMLRNAWLRKDLQSGTVGIGFLASIGSVAAANEALASANRRLQGQLQSLQARLQALEQSRAVQAARWLSRHPLLYRMAQACYGAGAWLRGGGKRSPDAHHGVEAGAN
jgi:cellulose synthase/poly-beta-1,6-N-acetylglucosamine synthase-like glycosyltransferase